LVFRSSTFTHWSEEWRAAEDWLTDVEKKLIMLKARVKRGGDFERWDLQVRNSLFSINQVLLTVEEHGGNKQMLKFRARRVPTKTWMLTILVLVTITAFAALDHASGVAIIFGFMTFVVFAAYFHDSASTMYDLKQAINSLPGMPLSATQVKEAAQPAQEELISDEVLEQALEDVRHALQHVSSEEPYNKELLKNSLTSEVVNRQLRA
jgi:hypothetical protein